MQGSCIAIALILALSSCKQEEALKFFQVGEVSFDVGYLSNHRYIGLIDDVSESLEYVYFGEPVTFKCIKFFDLAGEFKFEVSLRNAIDSIGKIGHLQVISPDSILVFGQYNNKILAINRKGEVWFAIDLNQNILPYHGHQFTYSTTYSGSCFFRDTLYLTPEYMAQSPGAITPGPNEYFKAALDQPYFLRINKFLDKTQSNYSFGLNSFYRQFMNDSMAMGELRRYSVLDENVAVFSIYSDTLYLFNSSSLQCIQKIHVVSSNTKIGVNPVQLYGDVDYAEYQSKIARFGGYISKVIYDSEYHFFVISIAWENKEKIPKGRMYSFCIYTKDGERLGEIALNKDDYDSGIVYYFKGLYYIKTASNDKEGRDKTKLLFHVFKLST